MKSRRIARKTHIYGKKPKRSEATRTRYISSSGDDKMSVISENNYSRKKRSRPSSYDLDSRSHKKRRFLLQTHDEPQQKTNKRTTRKRMRSDASDSSNDHAHKRLKLNPVSVEEADLVINNEVELEQSLSDREKFAREAQKYIEHDVSLMEAISGIISGINQRDDMVAVVYGGRAWAHCLGPYMGDISSAQKAAVQKGNIDLLILSNNPDFFSLLESGVYITQVTQWLLRIKNRIGGKYRVEVSSARPSGTLTASPLAFYCAITSNKNSPLQKLNRKLLFYVEINTKPVNIQEIKRNFVTTDQNKLFPFTYLNPLGLFLFSYFMTSGVRKERGSEKALPVDAIRTKLFETHLLDNVLTFTQKPDISHLIEYLVFNLYPSVFNIYVDKCSYYRAKQGHILNELLTHYDGLVTVMRGPGITETNEMSYSFFKKWIGSHIVLDAPKGQITGNGNLNHPSARQLFQHAFAILNAASIAGTGSCAKVGGDAIRHYDEDTPLSMDIDAKYFMYKHNALRIYKYAIVLIVVITQLYLEHARYFRVYVEYLMQIGDIPFVYKIDANAQPKCSKVRFLPKFVVPLVSIDVRLNASVEPLSTTSLEQPVKMRVQYTPLDISLIRKTEREVEGFVANKEPFATTGSTSAPTLDGVNFYLPPVASFKALHEDLKFITTDRVSVEAREAQGKKEKDLERLRTFAQLEGKAISPNLEQIRNRLNQVGFVTEEATGLLRDYDQMVAAIIESATTIVLKWVHKKNNKVKIERYIKMLSESIISNESVVHFISNRCGKDTLSEVQAFERNFASGDDSFETGWI